MKFGLSYLGILAILGVWGGFAAFAQDPGAIGVPTNTIVAPTPAGPLTLDLGNLTVPGALVVSIWLILQSEPVKGVSALLAGLTAAVARGTLPLHVRVDLRQGDETSGTFRVVRDD
jgi:hypothetical protein